MDARLTPAAVAVALATLGVAGAAHADPLQDLQVQVDRLTHEIAELQQASAEAAARARAADADVAARPRAADNAVTAGATKGSFKLPGSDTSVTLGGYVKLDAIYSDRSAGVGSTADLQYEPGSVPVGPTAGDNERGQVKLHARQSRFNIGTSTPTAWGDLTTLLEFDAFGVSGNESVSNSNALRVRHAYGTLGHLLIGQTWTTFSDVATYPETLDFGGPAGVIFARQAQVRWTQPFSGGQWAVALENPETVVALSGGESFRADDDRFPDLAGRIRFDTRFGTWSLAGLARQIRVDSASAPATREQKWGGAVGVSGVVPLPGGDDVRASAHYGNAIGRYAIGFFPDGLVDTTSHLVLSNEWLAMVAYRHFWRPGLRSTLALSGLRASHPAGTAGSVNRSAESAHLNLIWSPLARVDLGVEYIHATRQVESGDTGRLNRVQASALYRF